MEFTAEDSKMIKGLAVLAMVWLHLFDRHNFADLYTPIFFLKGLPLCYFFAQVSDWCVMGFAFVSGYGHCALFKEGKQNKYYIRKSLYRLLILYINYWIILFGATLLSILLGQGDIMPKSLLEFIGNFTTIICTYNISWWYMLPYAIIVLLSPLILKVVHRADWKLVLSISGFLYCAGYVLRIPMGDIRLCEITGKILMTLFEYVLGAVFYKQRFFGKVNEHKRKLERRIGRAWRIIICFAVFIGLLLAHTLISGNIIFSAVNGLIQIIIFFVSDKPTVVKKALLFFGKHSTNIWLVHLFLYASLFTNFVFIARYPLLIFCFTLLLCWGLSVLIELAMKPIRRKLKVTQ